MSKTATEGAQHRGSAVLHRHPRLRLGLLITPPMLWLGLAYLGALAALFITAFWDQNSFTGETIRNWNLDNFRLLFESDVYRRIALRTIAIAAGVTVLDIIIGFPIALYMAKVASPRMQRILVIAVLTPLWASYLVKAYAWRIMLSENGIVHDIGDLLGIDTPGYGLTATVITLAYLWLPFMILPIYAGMERLPDSMLEASADLGAKTGTRCGGWCCRRCSRRSSRARSSRSRCPSATTSPCGSSAEPTRCSATSSTTTSGRPTTCRSLPLSRRSPS